MDSKNILNDLHALAIGNDDYAAFNRRIVNTQQAVLGVRVPDMRRLAKAVAKEATADDTRKLLDEKSNIFEYIFTVGLIISYAKLDDAAAITLTQKWLGQVDSWAQIDSVADKNRRYMHTAWRKFVLECLESRQEFSVRFGVIVLMTNYLDEAHIDEVLDKLRAVKHDGYYVKMALAWTYATAAINFFDKVMNELASGTIDPWTTKKSYQKMRESRRFTEEQRKIIDQMRNRAR